MILPPNRTENEKGGSASDKAAYTRALPTVQFSVSVPDLTIPVEAGGSNRVRSQEWKHVISPCFEFHVRIRV